MMRYWLVAGVLVKEGGRECPDKAFLTDLSRLYVTTRLEGLGIEVCSFGMTRAFAPPPGRGWDAFVPTPPKLGRVNEYNNYTYRSDSVVILLYNTQYDKHGIIILY